MSTEANPPPPPRAQRTRLVQGQEVSLGCGTLLLIALIVMFFSGRGTGDLERRISRLQSSVRELKTTIDGQTHEIRQLQQKIDKLER